MRVVCIMQARMGSSRLPAKIMKNLNGKTVLEHDVNRLRRVKNIDEIVIATTIEEQDIVIVEEAKRLGVKYFRGSEQDVLSRYYFAAKENSADIVVRVTSDCPLLDSEVTEKIIEFYLNNKDKYDYVSNTVDRTYPRGLDTEVFSFKALERAFNNAELRRDREHVTTYIWNTKSDEFNIVQYKEIEDNSSIRLTLDTEEDYELISKIYDHFKQCEYFGLQDVLQLMERQPELLSINSSIEQKEV